MTKKQQHQVKAATPDAAEQNDAALDQAVGGGGLLFVPLPHPVRLASSDGTDKSIADGTRNT